MPKLYTLVLFSLALAACGSETAQSAKQGRTNAITSCIVQHGAVPVPQGTSATALAEYLASPRLAECIRQAVIANPVQPSER